MDPFTKVTGLVAPLDRVNVNTDEITPARFLKTIRSTGFDFTLFANWRYLDPGAKMPNPDFVLNQTRYKGATILLAGILPITLEHPVIRELFAEAEANEGYTVQVDLAAQTVTTPAGRVLRFEIDQFRKNALLQGLDNIGWTLSHSDEIAAYEQRRKQEAPWLFSTSPE